MIGVFDSGVGGLSILKALLTELPAERFIYLADAGHAPYGEKSDADVVARSRAVTAYLVGQGVQALVVACNTATAAAIDTLRVENPGLPIIGVEPGIKPALALSRTGRIGVMATRGTLDSPRFKRLMQAMGPVAEAAFKLQACDGLAMAIEQSTHQREADPDAETLVRATCAKHIAAMGEFGGGPGQMDTLVLGCTHYPFAEAVLQQLVGPAVQLIDPGEPVARQTRLRLQAIETLEGIDPMVNMASDRADSERVRLETTGDAHDLEAAVCRWLGLKCPALKVQCK